MNKDLLIKEITQSQMREDLQDKVTIYLYSTTLFHNALLGSIAFSSPTRIIRYRYISIINSNT